MATSEEKSDHICVSRSLPSSDTKERVYGVDGSTESINESEDNYGNQSDSVSDCYLEGQKVNEKMEERDVRIGSVNEVCPFVCGICSEKFDKVSVFYAHLKSHENLDVIVQINKKNEMLEALNVQAKVNDNVFKCGICLVEFPSMSLLHEHMVDEENVSDYSYSNSDHTARPDSRVVLTQNVSDNEIEEEIENIAHSSRNIRRKVKREAAETITSGTQANRKSVVTGKVLGSKEKNASFKETVENVVKSTIVNKRKQAICSSGKLSGSGSQKKRKSDDKESESKIVFPYSDVEQTPVAKTNEITGKLTPLTRSSQRISERYAHNRIDYKALAGLGSPKYDSDVTEGKTPRKDVSFSCIEKRKVRDRDAEKRWKNSKSMAVIKCMETDSGEDKETDLDDDSTENNVKGEKVKCKNNMHPKKIKRCSNNEVISCKSNENKEFCSAVTKKEESSCNQEWSDNDMVTGSDLEETEIEIREASDSTGQEQKVKDDGTYMDVNSDTVTAIKVEVDSDYVFNASDDDSDDDFREEEETYQDDEENDPDFEPHLDTEDGSEGNVTVNHSRSLEAYLKMFKVNKKKRISKNHRDGQPVKNCLYPCAICGRYYLWKALKKHMYAHVKVKVVQCAQCGKKYKSNRHLKDHIRSVHTMKKYGCPKCSSILKGNQSFEKHIMMHILKKEINVALDEVEKIEVSEEEYISWKSKQELLNGESYYRKRKKIKQTVSESQRQEEGIELDLLKDGPLHGDHIVLEDDVVGTTKNQYCKICRQNFPTHESMVQHLLEHNDEEQFSCSVCKGFFQTPEHLQNHMINVHGERELVCDICGERLRSSYALWAHKGKHLMKKDEYYSEEIVQKLQEEIAQRKSRRQSSVSRNNTKECEVCGMVVLGVRYKRHLEVHNTTKDWECEICHKFYKTRRYLLDHMKKTHNAEKVSCDICGQSFKGKNYLEIHKQTHGPKDKQCPHCGKGFTTLMYLKTHLLTHEEKKRFRCDQCMAAFSHRQRLSIHLVEVHGEGASRPCKYCGDLFPSRQKARRHERVAHEGYITPVQIKKKTSCFNVVKINEAMNESLENKIVRLMPPGSRYVAVSPGVVKVPISKNATIENNGYSSVGEKTVSAMGELRSETAENGQFIKLENGEEYQVMIEKEGNPETLEFVELTEEEQNVIIQEADNVISQSGPMTEEHDDNVEQILEIPENAEQCQILLYPDGTFKLLNVVDNTNNG